MARPASTPTKARRTTRARPAAKSAAKAHGSQALFQEMVERARLMTEQGLHQVDELREKVEAAPLARRFLHQIEEGGERFEEEKLRVVRQAEEFRLALRQLRDSLWHGLGLATVADLDKMGRQLRAVRSQLRRQDPTGVVPAVDA
ncbi:MAG: hypothetical protein ABIJ09_07220 [Pseudomonadota bacterium]